MRFRFLLVLAAFLTAPLAAQDLATPPPADGEVIQIEDDEEGGLTGGSVVDQIDFDDLGIAIPAFAADRDVPTSANSAGTAALGLELARVITADLQNNGLFKPTGPDALPRRPIRRSLIRSGAHGPIAARKCSSTDMSARKVTGG